MAEIFNPVREASRISVGNLHLLKSTKKSDSNNPVKQAAEQVFESSPNLRLLRTTKNEIT